MIEWSFDFMIEILDKASSQNGEDQKTRKMILLSNSEEQYNLFMQAFNSIIVQKPEDLQSYSSQEVAQQSQATVTPPNLQSNTPSINLQVNANHYTSSNHYDQLNSSRASILDENVQNVNPTQRTHQEHQIRVLPQMLKEGLDSKRQNYHCDKDENIMQTAVKIKRECPERLYRQQIEQIKQFIINSNAAYVDRASLGSPQKSKHKTSHNNANVPLIYKDLIIQVRNQADDELEKQSLQIYNQILLIENQTRKPYYQEGTGILTLCDQSINYPDNKLENDQNFLDQLHNPLQGINNIFLMDHDSECEWTLDIEERNHDKYSNKFQNSNQNYSNLLPDYSFESVEEKRNSVVTHINNIKIKNC
eukprot:403362198